MLKIKRGESNSHFCTQERMREAKTEENARENPFFSHAFNNIAFLSCPFSHSNHITTLQFKQFSQNYNYKFPSNLLKKIENNILSTNQARLKGSMPSLLAK
jgi:hypothetical protein